MKHGNPRDVFADLARFDSCSIANAVDSFKVRLLNEGFSGPGLVCRTGIEAPMVGVAVTLKVRSANPPMKAGFYLEQPDWWELIEESEVPRVLVIEDEDAHPGRGSLIGPVHACIMKALGFVGVVTTGAIRGTRRFNDIGLHAFSGNVSPAHAYCHVVEASKPVTVAGFKIRPGEIIHGDRDGVVCIPADLAERVPEAARRFGEREETICRFCGSPEFSRHALRSVITADRSR